MFTIPPRSEQLSAKQLYKKNDGKINDTMISFFKSGKYKNLTLAINRLLWTLHDSKTKIYVLQDLKILIEKIQKKTNAGGGELDLQFLPVAQRLIGDSYKSDEAVINDIAFLSVHLYSPRGDKKTELFGTCYTSSLNNLIGFINNKIKESRE